MIYIEGVRIVGAEPDDEDELARGFGKPGRAHPMLRLVLAHVCQEYAFHETVGNIKPGFICTSFFRTIKEDAALGGTRVHCYWRAIDLVPAGDAEDDVLSAIAAIVNDTWQYDPKKPKLPVCYAKTHGTGPHLHIQVSDRTRRR